MNRVSTGRPGGTGRAGAAEQDRARSMPGRRDRRRDRRRDQPRGPVETT